MADPADGVVEDLGGRESLVTALMGHNPETSSRQTLHEGVESPQSGAEGEVGNGLGRHVVVEEVEGNRKLGDVASNITQTADGRALEAVLGNGRAQLANGIVGDLELVAVGVDELAVALRSNLGLRAERREGGVRGRAGWGIGGRVRNGRGSRVGGDIASQSTRRAGGGGSSHLELEDKMSKTMVSETLSSERRGNGKEQVVENLLGMQIVC